MKFVNFYLLAGGPHMRTRRTDLTIPKSFLNLPNFGYKRHPIVKTPNRLVYDYQGKDYLTILLRVIQNLPICA